MYSFVREKMDRKEKGQTRTPSVGSGPQTAGHRKYTSHKCMYSTCPNAALTHRAKTDM